MRKGGLDAPPAFNGRKSGQSVNMTPPEIAGEIPRFEFIRERRSFGGGRQRRFRYTGESACGRSVEKSRDAGQIPHGHRVRLVHQAPRHTAPEAPAPEVPGCQTLRTDVVVHDQRRQVAAPGAGSQESQIHLFVFARQKTRRTSRPEIFSIGTNALQRRPSNHGVAPLEDAAELRVERLFATPRIDVAEHSQIVRGNPMGWGSRPDRRVRAADELELRIGREGAEDLLEPTLMDFFVVVNHADEFAGSCRDAGIQRARLPAPALVDDLNAPSVTGGHPFEQLRGSVG